MGSQGLLAHPKVVVVNPGSQAAHLSVHWFGITGNVEKEQHPTVQPKHTMGMAVPEQGLQGWLSIVSRVPVAPWGLLPVHGPELDTVAWASMDFYRTT